MEIIIGFLAVIFIFLTISAIIEYFGTDKEEYISVAIICLFSVVLCSFAIYKIYNLESTTREDIIITNTLEGMKFNKPMKVTKTETIYNKWSVRLNEVSYKIEEYKEIKE